jgi:hypothetical protein
VLPNLTDRLHHARQGRVQLLKQLHEVRISLLWLPLVQGTERSRRVPRPGLLDIPCSRACLEVYAQAQATDLVREAREWFSAWASRRLEP